MGREHDDAPERSGAEAAAEAEPTGDSAGVYYLSIEDFEARLPRPKAEDPPPEDP